MTNIKKALAAAAAASIMLSALTAVNGADDIRVLLDGKELTFDVPPQIVEGRTLVPLRAVFEALGAQVSWDGAEQKINALKDGTEIEMKIGSGIMRVNDTETVLDVVAQIIDDRTLVPARAVAEGFGAQVSWDEENRTVIIAQAATVQTMEPEPTQEASTDQTTADSDKLPIEYNDTPERSSSYMRDFALKSAVLNSSGNYDITYTLKTFLEGRGTVTVKFNCLDESGKIVDTWEAMFTGTDYTWSAQEGKTEISGKTAVIELDLK